MVDTTETTMSPKAVITIAQMIQVLDRLVRTLR